MKKALLIASLVVLSFYGFGRGYYDFSVVCETGQTLYYKIIYGTDHEVRLTYPGDLNDPYQGFEEPQGEIILPETVVYEEQTYVVSEIDKNTFRGCANLTGVLAIPNTVKSIGHSCFWLCSGFTQLVLPDALENIGYAAFYGCSGLTGTLVLPATITVLQSMIFGDCCNLTEVIFPSTLQVVESHAFSDCSGLVSLTLPSSLQTIENRAFWCCTGLTGTLYIPASVDSIGSCVFSYCNDLDAIIVDPDNPKYYSENNALITKNDKTLLAACKNTVIPDDIRGIGSYAFASMSNLIEVPELPLTLRIIDDHAFYACPFIGNLVLPDSLEFIGECAFSFCHGLNGSLAIPDAVTQIGDYAFLECEGFDGTLTLGQSLTSIGNMAFTWCTGFTGSLIIPNSVRTMGYSAFSHCSGFNGSLTIPEQLTVLREGTFYDCCGFSDTLTIGSFLQTIEALALYNVSNLSAIIAKPFNAPQAGADGIFAFIPTDIPIWVSCGSVESYQNAAGWNAFTNYNEDFIYAFQATSTDESLGTVVILQEPSCDNGNVAIVQAVPKENAEFYVWKNNGFFVSSNPTYSLEVKKDCDLKAYFRLCTNLNEATMNTPYYPNPTKGLLHIDLPEVQFVEVFDLLGKSVFISEKATIDLTGLHSGVYVVKIKLSDGQIKTGKVLKE